MIGSSSKVNLTKFAALVCAVSTCNLTSVASPSNKILDMPNWGFVSKKAISRSLIFDQSFDKVSYRPQPVPKTSIAIAAPASPTEPLTFAFKEPETKNIESPTTPAPEALKAILPPELMESVHAQLELTTRGPLVASTSLRVPASVTPFVAPAKATPASAPAEKSLFQTNSQTLSLFAKTLPPIRTVASVPASKTITLAQNNPPASPAPTPPAPPPPPTPPGPSPKTLSWKQPKAEAEVAKIYVISEESLMAGDIQPVVGAQVKWVAMNSGLESRTDVQGVARSPYKNTASMRFIVSAPGFLPSVGYAIGGLALPVVLTSESRLAPMIQSLGVIPDPAKTLVVGKIVDKKLRPIQNMTVDASLDKPFAVYYSFGDLGIFHPKAKATGPQGDFFISGMRDGIQYLMPSLNIHAGTQAGALDSEQIREWPASIIDLSGLPSVVTVTLIEPVKASAQTQVLDAQNEEKPDVGVHLTIGGQRGVYVPDSEGFFKLADLHQRNSVDLVEIRAQGFIKTWVNSVPNAQNFPSTVLLFRQSFLDEIFQENLYEVDFAKGVTLGHLRPERFSKPVEIRVYSNKGKESPQAKIFYADAENNLNLRQKATDPLVQSFAVANLEAGEWHVLALDPKTQKVIDAQILRIEAGTVSQLQF